MHPSMRRRVPERLLKQRFLLQCDVPLQSGLERWRLLHPNVPRRVQLPRQLQVGHMRVPAGMGWRCMRDAHLPERVQRAGHLRQLQMPLSIRLHRIRLCLTRLPARLQRQRVVLQWCPPHSPPPPPTHPHRPPSKTCGPPAQARATAPPAGEASIARYALAPMIAHMMATASMAPAIVTPALWATTAP